MDTFTDMCNFCEAISNKCKIIWNKRSTFARDNFYDFMYETNNYQHVNHNCNFKILTHEYENDYYLSVSYLEIAKSDNFEVIINPFTESIKLNFCPNCGRQLSENIEDITENNVIKIIK